MQHLSSAQRGQGKLKVMEQICPPSSSSLCSSFSFLSVFFLLCFFLLSASRDPLLFRASLSGQVPAFVAGRGRTGMVSSLRRLLEHSKTQRPPATGHKVSCSGGLGSCPQQGPSRALGSLSLRNLESLFKKSNTKLQVQNYRALEGAVRDPAAGLNELPGKAASSPVRECRSPGLTVWAKKAWRLLGCSAGEAYGPEKELLQGLTASGKELMRGRSGLASPLPTGKTFFCLGPWSSSP